MSGSVLMLVVSVAFAEGNVASLEKGLLDGLRAGDAGIVYYELTVGGQKKPIEVGEATVVEATELGATCRVSGKAVRPGYLIRFELPAERVLPATILQYAREKLDPRRFNAVVRALLDRMIPEDEEIEATLARYLATRRSRPASTERVATPTAPTTDTPAQEQRAALETHPFPSSTSQAIAETPGVTVQRQAREEAVSEIPATTVDLTRTSEPAAEEAAPGEVEPTATPTPSPETMVEIGAGSFAIGLSLSEAGFYSQHPRFRINLDAFAIDLEMVRRTEFLRYRLEFVFPASDGDIATSITLEEATDYCAWRAKRLPTEFEWEAAMSAGGLKPGLLEWTSSWYKPYPGNKVPEDEYGERFKVLRGSPNPAEFDPRRRRFAAPGARHHRLGFRCARDLKSS